MKLEHMLEVEQTIHEIEERSDRNRLGMLVTKQVAEYRAHGAKQDVETLLGVVNAVLDLLVDSGQLVHAEAIVDVIHEAMHKEGKLDVAV